jgi:hypothetical protein
MIYIDGHYFGRSYHSITAIEYAPVVNETRHISEATKLRYLKYIGSSPLVT